MAQRWSVPGIACEHCKAAIEGDVGALPGVESVEVDVAGQTVDVEGEVDPAAVEAAIAAAGYEEMEAVT